VTERERPSRHGKILGEALALIATAGRKDAPMPLPDMCMTCAFREGSMPNQMAATGKTAMDCVLGIDRDRFACHHGMRDGQPKKICVGYIAARLAPFSFVKEVIASIHAELAEIERDTADPVRAAFDAWVSEVDPGRKLDDYQLALWLADRGFGGQMNTIIGLWFLSGFISHIYWWDQITEGKWSGPAIPLCVLTVIQASFFGPLTFLFEWWLYWLMNK
jgi:hypothetical protein